MAGPSIRTEDLVRRYDPQKRALRLGRFRRGRDRDEAERAQAPVLALAGVSLEVREGELFGLLGPNGAGKTTLIKILSTLLLPTSGRAWVDGLDVTRDVYAVRRRINMVSGGETSGYGILTVRENLWLFSQLYGVPSQEALARIDRLLDVVELAEKAGAKMNRLSTGQRQKLNFARGFVSDPKVLFLDEPTLGLDVGVARRIRAFVRQWVHERPGRTLLLTTHYMAEADELCDRVAIIDRGRVLACDTPSRLKRQVESDTLVRLELAWTPGADAEEAVRAVRGIPEVVRVGSAEDAASGHTRLDLILRNEAAIDPVFRHLAGNGGRVLSFSKAEPTLEDVFLKLVGRRLTEGTPGSPSGTRNGQGTGDLASGSSGATVAGAGEAASSADGEAPGTERDQETARAEGGWPT
ncbi:ABC transporter ATP-binding protein [Limnochorda pilosa]|uniref:ABC transporter n=1 Tax=Limnochorda pilosa TaxID=1555112 RepID=A0A0K2SQB4_LIMPI|nr:ABC transporter ATP-binding protein [Limnochorda pilosa]BAS29291.1 ABC transporter [Limnochorda pilosa]